MRSFYSRSVLSAVLALAGTAVAQSDIVEDVRHLIDSGDFFGAYRMAEEELESHPKSNLAGSLNALAGEALFLDGKYAQAVPFLEKARARNVADAYLYSGKLAMLEYDFPLAVQMYEKYISLKEKASKAPDENVIAEKEAASLGSEMLERVEDITVIDRIDVPANQFFSHYKLSPESGRLLDWKDVESDYSERSLHSQVESPVFQSERGDFRMWAERDTTGDGESYIVESGRFVGGGWEEPQRTDEVLNGGGNAAFPFMMADGSTLYFSSDGDGSIGGYDIFRSNRDSATGEYMAPVNMGMPYNSPYNDYMLAIDESTGIGWWATDRNSLEDNNISIYLFIPNDLRKNYDSENPQIKELAKLSDITLTQNEEDEETIQSLRDKVKEMEVVTSSKIEEFQFPVGSGKIYRNMDDFKSSSAREKMQIWLSRNVELKKNQETLSSLRRQFSQNSFDKSLRSKIVSLEQQVERESKALDKLRGEIIRDELKSL